MSICITEKLPCLALPDGDDPPPAPVLIFTPPAPFKFAERPFIITGDIAAGVVGVGVSDQGEGTKSVTRNLEHCPAGADADDGDAAGEGFSARLNSVKRNLWNCAAAAETGWPLLDFEEEVLFVDIGCGGSGREGAAVESSRGAIAVVGLAIFFREGGHPVLFSFSSSSMGNQSANQIGLESKFLLV